MAFMAGAGDEITLHGRVMLHPSGRAARPRSMPERPGDDLPARERAAILEPARFSRLGLVSGLRTVNARVGAKRLALCVCIADAKAQNRQCNEDHALHRNSPIYCPGEMPGLAA
jgi:hypothetical protein